MTQINTSNHVFQICILYSLLAESQKLCTAAEMTILNVLVLHPVGF